MLRRVWPQKRDQELFSREVVVGDGYKIQGGQLIEIKKEMYTYSGSTYYIKKYTGQSLNSKIPRVNINRQIYNRIGRKMS